MSLVNQMLKDLAKRSPVSHSAQNTVPNLQISYPQAQRRIEKSKWILLFLIVSISMVFLYKVLSHRSPKTLAINPPVKNILLVKPRIEKTSDTPAPAFVAASIALTGVTIQIQQETTSLRFLFNQAPLYRINSQPDKNILSLTLENAHLVAELPPIDYANSAIETMTITPQLNKNLTIILTLKAGAELKYATLNAPNKLPELQLDFSAMEKSSSQKAIVMEKKEEGIKKIVVDLTVNEQYQQALTWLDEGKLHDAMQLLNTLVVKFPTYTPARESLAALWLQQGHKLQAKLLIEAGLQEQPLHPAFIELKARILVQENQLSQALHLLETAAPSLKDHLSYYAMIAALTKNKESHNTLLIFTNNYSPPNHIMLRFGRD